MLREYTQRVSNVLASVIKQEGELKELSKGLTEYRCKEGALTELLEFQHDAKTTPEVGDYIVFKDDQYSLMDKELFEKKYNPSGFKLR